MDRLEAMSIVVTVAESGSFSAASRKLGTPLPTICRKVAELEAHLNARLLIRSTRKLALTDAGAAYFTACKRILQAIGEAEHAASGEHTAPRGELVITAPIVLGRLHVLPVVIEFLACFPDVDVRLRLSDRNAHLIDDHIDIAVRIGELTDSGLIATRVGDVRRVVCGSPRYFAGHGIPRVPADLSELGCITFDALESGASWTFAVPGRNAGQTVPIRSRLSVNTAEAALDAAIAGAGITRVLSYQAARGLDEGRLRVVLAEFEPEPMPIHLVYPGQGLVPLKMRSFLEFAAPRLRSALTDNSDDHCPVTNSRQ
jgi:DNA-binding transcriptional LysR family regulator